MTKQDANQKIKEIVNKIVTEYKPEKIILFGSFAWGNPTDDSDVDLFIIKRSREKKMSRSSKLRSKIYGSNLPAMDIMVYTPKEVEKSINEYKNLFIEDIMRNGKVLYNNPQQKNFAIHFPERQLKVLH